MTQKLIKGARITGPGREDLTNNLVERYERGESIRSIAHGIGRSYGFVHGVLADAEVALRTRGGATRGAEAVARREAVRAALRG